MKSATTSWHWEYAVRRGDGAVLTHESFARSPHDAGRHAEYLNAQAKSVGAKDLVAVVIRRKVTRTVTVRIGAWEDDR